MKKEEGFIKHVKGMAQRLEREHEAGAPCLLLDLSEEHPTICLTKDVDPDYEKQLLLGARV